MNLDVAITFKLNLTNGLSPLGTSPSYTAGRGSRSGRIRRLAAEMSPTAQRDELRALRGGDSWPRQESQGRASCRREAFIGGLKYGQDSAIQRGSREPVGDRLGPRPRGSRQGGGVGSKHLLERPVLLRYPVPLSWCWRAIEAPRRRPDTDGLGGW